MDELHDQTVNLLSFQQMPKPVFGTQAAFNIFAQPIEGAHPSLQEIESRIVRHFKALAHGEQFPRRPCFSCRLRSSMATPSQCSCRWRARSRPPNWRCARRSAYHVTSEQDEYPSNVNVAGSSEILVSVRADGVGGKRFLDFCCLRQSSRLGNSGGRVRRRDGADPSPGTIAMTPQLRSASAASPLLPPSDC